MSTTEKNPYKTTTETNPYQNIYFFTAPVEKYAVMIPRTRTTLHDTLDEAMNARDEFSERIASFHQLVGIESGDAYAEATS